MASRALLFFSYLSIIASSGYSLSFNFTENGLNYSDIVCIKDASYSSNICQNLAQQGLTRNAIQSSSNYSTGMAYYNRPVPLWDNRTGEVTNFITTFTFKIDYVNPQTQPGDGLAFFISAYPPPSTNTRGGSFGLFNQTTYLNESANHIVAVEFDTFQNEWDPNNTICHTGIDINTLRSTVYGTIPNCSILIGNTMAAQISYSNSTQNLTLNLWREDDLTMNFTISTKVDLKSFLPNEMAIGFSASTGAAVELHLINSWSFSSTLEVHPSTNSTLEVTPGTSDKRTFSTKVISAVIGSAIILLLLLGMLLYLVKQKRSAKKNKEIEMMNCEFEKGRGPKGFLYKELAAATNDFAENEKLGEGGFGSVYRGILVDEGTQVAIKKVSKDSKQGKKEYIAEVKIISQLRHRNLVQLIGWCHDNSELLLIYELMHNGSLDAHLYHQEKVLTWAVRHKIVQGVGFALLYLHKECQHSIVHRDIKPSNIMLDSSFNAKLGDFGLARLIDREAGAQATMPAGTTGYIAPECVLTGMMSTDSDMYSFGIVLLEIACGRRPVVLQQDAHKIILVEWVWSLYGTGSILDAVDQRLNGEFEVQEAERLMVVGLWCTHPDYSSRPSIRQAINALNFEAPLPTLPPTMPQPIYVTSMDGISISYSYSISISTGEIGHANTQHSTATSSGTSALLAPVASSISS